MGQVRAVFRLLGDLRDLRGDPTAWEPLMAERLCGLMGARQATCLRLGQFLPDAHPVLRSAVHAGSVSGSAAHWEAKLRAGETRSDPQILRGTQLPDPVVAAVRPELVSDDQFYGNGFIQDLLRMSDIDAHAAGWFHTGPRGEVLLLAFQREWRGKPATMRQRNTLRLFLEELYQLWHAGKMAVPPNAPTAERGPARPHLSPREREVLDLLLTGETVKGTAAQLGLSHRTVEGHVKSLHRKFEVSSRGELLAKCLRQKLPS